MIRKSSLVLSLFAASAIPALASVTVNAPSNGATVSPQFTLSAVATTCSNQTVSAMGFSLDSSSNTTIVHANQIDATVTSATGAHTLHVKAWGDNGSSCVADVTLNVVASSTSSTPVSTTSAPAPAPASTTTDGIGVSQPANNATVSSPFTLDATATKCSSQPVGSMGYSLDNSSVTTIVKSTLIAASVTASAGAHTVHVKSWGTSGASCVVNIAITVASPASTPAPASTAATVEGISVSKPVNNTVVSSPFTLDAAASDCSSQPVGSMGYSLDNSSVTAIVKSTSVAATVTASAGAHTLHVKSWGNSGASCVANIAITVASSPSSSTPVTTAGGVTIGSPANGASVTSPFGIAASAATCSSQTVTSIGYALDSASNTIATGTALSTQISASTGSHTLHVTAWGSGGATCSASVVVNVSDPSNSIVPADAVSVSSIQALSTWEAAHDPATGASSSGSMAMVSSPSLSGNARQFNTSFTNSGGEIYHISFGDDATSANFFYDGWVYLTSSASNVANLEMDMNQVTSNGQTVIYGFQCDGYSGTWDYTENAGSPTSPSDHWVHSSAACDVRNWTQNAWHHVQISYSRDDSGNVTYHSVWLDGAEAQINATVPSSFALGWSQVLLTNFQVDGIGSGSDTVYLDKLTISRW